MIISFFIIDKGLPVPASTLIKEVESGGWGVGGWGSSSIGKGK